MSDLDRAVSRARRQIERIPRQIAQRVIDIIRRDQQ